MTGAETKRQVMEAGDALARGLQATVDVADQRGEPTPNLKGWLRIWRNESAAFAPCIVLTAEEAKFLRSRIGWYSRSLKLERDDDALALLTPEEASDA